MTESPEERFVVMLLVFVDKSSHAISVSLNSAAYKKEASQIHFDLKENIICSQVNYDLFVSCVNVTKRKKKKKDRNSNHKQ